MSDCEHKWVLLSTHYDKKRYNTYDCKYIRVDRFFCEKCCVTKDVQQDEVCYSDDGEPIWWKH